MQSANILIFNCGSSSLNYKVFRSGDQTELPVIAYGKAHHVGVRSIEPSLIEHHFPPSKERVIVPIAIHRQAAGLVLDYLKQKEISCDLIGHRFVHGGTTFQQAVFLTEENIQKLTACSSLAPIHNPNSMSVIEICQETFPGIAQYACFDTAFHASLPDWARIYALPADIAAQYGLRKYGFHGLSYQFVCAEIARFLGKPLEELRVIACHLGTGGSSVAAVQHGHAIDTSMGYSPLPGLMMGTRPGDLDPLLLLHMMRKRGISSAEMNTIINKKSGLLGISGFSSDIRDITRRMSEDEDPASELAFDMYVHRLKKYIGAYAAVMGGMDVLAFTDDVGLWSWPVREKTCQDMSWCGLELDVEANHFAAADRISQISTAHAPVMVLTVPTDEELVIGMEGARLLKEKKPC